MKESNPHVGKIRQELKSKTWLSFLIKMNICTWFVGVKIRKSALFHEWQCCCCTKHIAFFSGREKKTEDLADNEELCFERKFMTIATHHAHSAIRPTLSPADVCDRVTVASTHCVRVMLYVEQSCLEKPIKGN